MRKKLADNSKMHCVFFIHDSVELLSKGRAKPMRGSRYKMLSCLSHHCVVSSMDMWSVEPMSVVLYQFFFHAISHDWSYIGVIDVCYQQCANYKYYDLTRTIITVRNRIWHFSPIRSNPVS